MKVGIVYTELCHVSGARTSERKEMRNAYASMVAN